MPPPPPPANVYPCIDWVPQGVARPKPDRLKLTSEELRTVIASAKTRALEARRRLGQVVAQEHMQQQEEIARKSAKNGKASRLPGSVTSSQNDVNDDLRASTGRSSEPTVAVNDEDDIIMKEYGLEDYDDEDEDEDVETKAGNQEDDDVSEDDLGEENSSRRTVGVMKGLADNMATLTYHSSNAEDPYMIQANTDQEDDDKEDEEELIIKPTDNLILAGHVSKEESSIEVYVYDNETNDFYLHHDIIQADYPCCLKWIGHAKNESRNFAAAGYMSPDILLWDLDVVDVLEPFEILRGHKDAVIDLSWNHQVKHLIASGSADKHVRLWNLDECKSISNIKMFGKVSALEFGIFEQFLLLAGDLDRNVSLIDTRTSTVTNNWKLCGEVEKVRWAPIDHTKFLVSDDQGYIYYFDTRETQALMKFRAHQISVTGLEFSPKCDDMLVTASADNTIKVWDTKTAFRGGKNSQPELELVKDLSDLNVGNVLSLRMCPNSLGMIAVGGDSKCNSFKTYDLTRDEEVRERFMK